MSLRDWQQPPPYLCPRVRGTSRSRGCETTIQRPKPCIYRRLSSEVFGALTSSRSISMRARLCWWRKMAVARQRFWMGLPLDFPQFCAISPRPISVYRVLVSKTRIIVLSDAKGAAVRTMRGERLRPSCDRDCVRSKVGNLARFCPGQAARIESGAQRTKIARVRYS